MFEPFTRKSKRFDNLFENLNITRLPGGMSSTTDSYVFFTFSNIRLLKLYIPQSVLFISQKYKIIHNHCYQINKVISPVKISISIKQKQGFYHRASSANQIVDVSCSWRHLNTRLILSFVIKIHVFCTLIFQCVTLQIHGALSISLLFAASRLAIYYDQFLFVAAMSKNGLTSQNFFDQQFTQQVCRKDNRFQGFNSSRA